MTVDQRRAERYLMQIRNADREITDIILRIDYLRYKASGTGAIRYDKDNVQTSPEDMVCDALTEAVYLESKLSDRNKELMRMRFDTEKIIALWNDNRAKFISAYYLKRGSMTDAAKICHCSSRHIYRVKLDALDAFSTYCAFSKNNT